MYLKHFKLNNPPFSLTPNTDFYCDLPTHQDALAVLLLSLQMGEGFIKIIGEVGAGKTLLCRLLLNHLDDNYVTAYIPNPDKSGYGLRLALAHELGLVLDKDIPYYLLLDKITQRLLELHQSVKHVVLVIDEAQALSEDALEAIRLLTNLETEEKKLLQVVLFGQPELDVKLNQHKMRQLKQRITFSYYLRPLSFNEINFYLSHRLAKAGFTYGSLFTPGAKKRLCRASKGIPRLLNILCHKALLVSYGRGAQRVDTRAMKRAISDTLADQRPEFSLNFSTLLMIVTGCSLSVLLLSYWKLGLFS